MDGVLIIDKPKNCTSHDVVFKIRKALGTKKVGHAGTLDPMATGVLPILVGKGTKIAKYLIEHDKVYEATIKLGEKTDTADGEGKCIEKKSVSVSCFEEINVINALENVKGKQKQIPPMYSAIKVNGKKLYEYAREGIEIKPEARDIEIYNISLIEIDKENQNIKFNVKCSKGTYIRVLCEQIAENLGTVGYMSDLRRIEVENFKISQSVTLKQIEENKDNKCFLGKTVIGIEKIFENKGVIELNEKDLQLFLNGVLLKKDLLDNNYRVYDQNKRFIGLGIVRKNLLKRDIIL